MLMLMIVVMMMVIMMAQVTKEEMLDAEPIDSYVVVCKEDVLEAIGAFVAAYLAELPEAQNLQPAQLQAALKTTFKVCPFCTSLSCFCELVSCWRSKEFLLSKRAAFCLHSIRMHQGAPSDPHYATINCACLCASLVGRMLQLLIGMCRLQELKKGRVRRLWEWGRMLYRITAFSYGAFSVYENPWLVRAVLAALWTACRILMGAGVKSLM